MNNRLAKINNFDAGITSKQLLKSKNHFLAQSLAAIDKYLSKIY